MVAEAPRATGDPVASRAQLLALQVVQEWTLAETAAATAGTPVFGSGNVRDNGP
jgi:hypothetical protein